MSCRVLFAAAHADFPDTEPLGGGKAVADYLCRKWRASAPFPLEVLSPNSLGVLPRGQTPSLTGMSEWQYARFCRQFEQATTAAILRHNPRDCVVLTNDISEGPDFADLGARGYRLVSIWHVDVVEYFTKFYLRNWVRPETAARWSRYPFLPDVLKLVFHKQADCVRHSAQMIVPSPPMKDMIGRCYADVASNRVTVLPWGNLAPAAPANPVVHTDNCPAVGDDEVVIITLSRLSPEKGIERLLAALPYLEGRFQIWICGAPAYMKGEKYAQRLRRMADHRVRFLGHVTGALKEAALHRADVFVSPSRHESYGLTIAEATAAGCRVVSHSHYGATGTVVDCDRPRELAQVLNGLIQTGRTTRVESTVTASEAAEQLARLILELGPATPS